jgi:hypothetical protein
VRLNSSATTYYAARIYLTNPALVNEDGTIARGTLLREWSHYLRGGTCSWCHLACLLPLHCSGVRQLSWTIGAMHSQVRCHTNSAAAN